MLLSIGSSAMAIKDAQSLYVNLELTMSQTTVGAVIQSISEQTGYEFSYDEAILNKKITNLSLNVKNVRIETVLNEIFKNTDITYQIVDNRIFLRDVNNAIILPQINNQAIGNQQDNINVKGVVVDEKESLSLGRMFLLKEIQLWVQSLILMGILYYKM